MLVEEKLLPLGVVAPPPGAPAQELKKNDPLLALKLKTGVVPERAVNAVTRVFKPLFLPPVVIAVLAGFLALDGWLFFVHGVAPSMRDVLYNPLFILLLLGMVVVSAAFHECGHATACAYGGARPGQMGVGLYLVWPAFYTDVTDAYRLGRGGRLRTDLGGLYFNAIFVLATFGVYFLTGWEPLLLIVPLQIIEMIHQLMPFLRLDGYYIVSDLTGVPDMFARIKPTLKSLNPFADSPDEVTVLKPWVRVAVTAYVFTVIPLLLLILGMTIINVPRILSTAWDSFMLMKGKLGHESGLASAVTVIQMGLLLLPIAGLAAMFWQLGKTLVLSGWHRTEGRPAARGALVLATAVAAAGAAYVWFPNGDYRPIQPGERGTVLGAVSQLSYVQTGRPALTPERTTQLEGAPTQRSLPAAQRQLGWNTGSIFAPATPPPSSSDSTVVEPGAAGATPGSGWPTAPDGRTPTAGSTTETTTGPGRDAATPAETTQGAGLTGTQEAGTETPADQQPGTPTTTSEAATAPPSGTASDPAATTSETTSAGATTPTAATTAGTTTTPAATTSTAAAAATAPGASSTAPSSTTPVGTTTTPSSTTSASPGSTTSTSPASTTTTPSTSTAPSSATGTTTAPTSTSSTTSTTPATTTTTP